MHSTPYLLCAIQRSDRKNLGRVERKRYRFTVPHPKADALKGNEVLGGHWVKRARRSTDLLAHSVKYHDHLIPVHLSRVLYDARKREVAVISSKATCAVVGKRRVAHAVAKGIAANGIGISPEPFVVPVATTGALGKLLIEREEERKKGGRGTCRIYEIFCVYTRSRTRKS